MTNTLSCAELSVRIAGVNVVGNLDLAIEPLINEYQADQLSALNEQGA